MANIGDCSQYAIDFFQYKDLASPLVAIAALSVSGFTFYNSFWKRPSVIATNANELDVAPLPGIPGQFRILWNCLFYNSGASPAMITSLILRVKRLDESNDPPFDVAFEWKEIVSRKEVRAQNEMHHKGIRAAFESRAFALPVPKNEAVSREIMFFPPADALAFRPGRYAAYLKGSFIGRGNRPTVFQSATKRFEVSEDDNFKLACATVHDEDGKYLYSNHVRIRTFRDDLLTA